MGSGREFKGFCFNKSISKCVSFFNISIYLIKEEKSNKENRTSDV